MRSVMGHTFSQVPKAEIARSQFDLSHGHKTSFNAGYLVPIYLQEIYPGDTFNVNMTGFARLSTPLHPIMDNLFMNTFFFFVPLRLLWANFQKMMGEQLNPGDSIDYTIPQMVSTAGTGYLLDSIFDHLGLPTEVPGLSHSALPLRACNLIWNEWFRDQNLQTRVTVPTTDGPDLPTLYTMMRRGKRHDYFSSSLPWPQKGTGVSIPLGTTAPIMGLGFQAASGAAGASGAIAYTASAANDIPAATPVFSGANMTVTAQSLAAPSGTNRPQLYADLTNAASATINALRNAFAVQQLVERDARGGTRYTEILRAHFNVTSPDARLQRPEYLGGGQSPVNLYQVPQTANPTGSTTPQGNLAAYGTSSFSGHGFTKSFVEHGIVLGFVSCRADLNYQQGLDRYWSRLSRYDFMWPELVHIGEQAVLNKEIFAQGTANPTADAAAWGYQERFAELRFKSSIITGQLRSNAATPLDTWHLAQYFATAPALNDAFIQDNPPIDRVVAVPSEPDFIFDSYFKVTAARPLPVYGVPGMTRL